MKTNYKVKVNVIFTYDTEIGYYEDEDVLENMTEDEIKKLIIETDTENYKDDPPSLISLISECDMDDIVLEIIE
jgi:hypothetical protein